MRECLLKAGVDLGPMTNSYHMHITFMGLTFCLILNYRKMKILFSAKPDTFYLFFKSIKNYLCVSL